MEEVEAKRHKLKPNRALPNTTKGSKAKEGTVKHSQVKVNLAAPKKSKPWAARRLLAYRETHWDSLLLDSALSSRHATQAEVLLEECVICQTERARRDRLMGNEDPHDFMECSSNVAML